MISVRGLVRLWEIFKTRGLGLIGKAGLVGLVFVVGLDLTGVVAFMIKWHPYEYLYFNELAGGVAGTRGKMEWDYYGLAHRRLLECLVQKHPEDGKLRVLGCSPVFSNLAILDPSKRSKIKIVGLVDAGFRYQNPKSFPIGRDTYYLMDLRGGQPGWSEGVPAICKVEIEGNVIAKAVRLKQSASSPLGTGKRSIHEDGARES